MGRVVWSHEARHDLREIVDFIKIENRAAAKRVLLDLRLAGNSLDIFPKRGRVVPEFQRHGIYRYRELIHKNWRIIYTIRGQTVQILGCFDTRQDVANRFGERT